MKVTVAIDERDAGISIIQSSKLETERCSSLK